MSELSDEIDCPVIAEREIEELIVLDVRQSLTSTCEYYRQVQKLKISC